MEWYAQHASAKPHMQGLLLNGIVEKSRNTTNYFKKNKIISDKCCYHARNDVWALNKDKNKMEWFVKPSEDKGIQYNPNVIDRVTC